MKRDRRKSLYARRMGQPTQRATNYTARSNIVTAQILLHANGQRPNRAMIRQRSRRRQRRREPYTEHGLGVLLAPTHPPVREDKRGRKAQLQTLSLARLHLSIVVQHTAYIETKFGFHEGTSGLPHVRHIIPKEQPLHLVDSSFHWDSQKFGLYLSLPRSLLDALFCGFSGSPPGESDIARAAISGHRLKLFPLDISADS